MDAITKYNTSGSNPLPQDAGKIYSRAGILFFELDAQGIIISLNSSAEEKLQCQESDYIGIEIYKFTNVQYRSRLKMLIDQCINRGIVREEPVILLAGQLEEKHFLFNAISYNDENGNPALLHIYLKEVTTEYQLRKLIDLSSSISKYIPITIKSLPIFLEKIRETLSVTYAGCTWPGHGRLHVIDPTIAPIGIQPVCLSWPVEQWEEFASEINIYNADNGEIGGFIESLDEIDTKFDKDKAQLLRQVFDKIQFVAVWSIQLESGNRAFLYVLKQLSSSIDMETFKFISNLTNYLSGIDSSIKSSDKVAPNMLSGIQEFSLMGMMEVRDGIISNTNQWIQENLGKPKSALTGQRLVDLISEEDRDRFEHIIGGGFNEEKNDGNCIIALKAKNNSTFNVRASFTIDEIDGKPVHHWYFISRKDEERLEYQLRQVRKVEAMGLIAGGMVHDFNNLMAVILGFSSLLNEEIKSDSPYYNDIQKIHKSSEQASERISRLMAFTQNSACIREKLDLNQLVKEVAGILSRLSDKSLIIRADLDEKLHKIKADSSQIQQVILQLALNAKESMPYGGKMFFKTRNIDVGDRGLWKKQGVKPGQYIQLTVSDTGDGMDSTIKSRIFDPGSSTKPVDSGFGYGLTFVKEILDDHNGFISVFSEPNKGSMIKVHFPTRFITEKNEDSVKDELPLLGSETILLVDDEQILRETARKMLLRYGYKVLSAKTPSEAVGLYKKYNEKIDLIILDLHIRGASVKRIMQKFNQISPGAKVLGAVEKGEIDFDFQNYQGLIEQYVEKPYQVRPLMQSLRGLLNA
ncbi:response regulator [bacterium]|nr:response regulator [bacterium]